MKRLLSFFFVAAGSLSAQDLHIVFIGNSITQGAQLADVATEAPAAEGTVVYMQSDDGSAVNTFTIR